MSKSKSHPCLHPTSARRTDGDTFFCKKCGQSIDSESGEVIQMRSTLKVVKKSRKYHPSNRQHRHGHYEGTEKG